MNIQLKNTIGIVAIIVALVLGYAALDYSNSFSNSAQGLSARVFSVTGDGKAVAVPDVAQFTFSVITEGGTDIPAIQKDNTAKTNTIIDFVKSQNIDSKDIETQNYSIDPRYQTYNCVTPLYGMGATVAPIGASTGSSSIKPCPPAKIVGYTITQTISVKVRDFSKTGTIISGVTEKGANSVSQLSFSVDNPDTYKNQARAEAIKKAQDKAQAIASETGFKIGKLISIDDNSYYPIYAAMGKGGASTLESNAASAPTIEPGSQEITANVTLRYEIK